MIRVQQSRRQNKKKSATIDMAPLIDMVFILLIFFIVTSTFSPETAVKIDRPEMSATSLVPSKSLIISVTSDGKITIDNQEIAQHQIESYIKAAVLENPKVSVLVLSDKKAAIEHALSILDACRKAGVEANIAAEGKTNQ